jgi:hypothetical protein
MVPHIGKIIETVVAALTTITAFVGVAEDLFQGGQRGAEKKTYVVGEVSKLLGSKVNAFWSGDLGKVVIAILIDVIVSAVNREGNPSTSPAPSAS